MADLEDVLIAGLQEAYELLGKKVVDLARPLSEEQFWKKPFAFGNSVGHLVLHLTGNLNYYIGAHIAQTAYIRDREREFTETSHPSKGDVLKKFDVALGMVLKTIHAQSADNWAAAYTAKGAEDIRNRLEMVIRCAMHLDHHVGQMQYLCYALS